MTLSDTQRALLLHMTGLDRGAEPNRRHFAAQDGGSDYRALLGLVQLGLATGPSRNEIVYPDTAFFYTTPQGIVEARRLREGVTT